MLTKELLMKADKEHLIAGAIVAGVPVNENMTKAQIADLYLEHTGKMDATPAKTRPKKARATPEEIDVWLADTGEWAQVERKGDVVTLRYHGRETCVNINAPIGSLKQAASIFAVDLGGPVEAAIAR